jgi:sugar (pentulose or hexulose) kinase
MGDNMNRNATQGAIERGRTALGIEFRSTCTKAILVSEDLVPAATGSHEWENRHENGIWTYSLEDIWTGLHECYRDLRAKVLENYAVELQTIGAIGFSGMMLGYMAFGENEDLLIPSRTWRNSITEEAAVLTPESWTPRICGVDRRGS